VILNIDGLFSDNKDLGTDFFGLVKFVCGLTTKFYGLRTVDPLAQKFCEKAVKFSPPVIIFCCKEEFCCCLVMYLYTTGCVIAEICVNPSKSVCVSLYSNLSDYRIAYFVNIVSDKCFC